MTNGGGQVGQTLPAMHEQCSDLNTGNGGSCGSIVLIGNFFVLFVSLLCVQHGSNRMPLAPTWDTNLLTANLLLCFECQHGFFRNLLHSIRRRLSLSPKRTRKNSRILCNMLLSHAFNICNYCACVCHTQLYTYGIMDSDIVTIARTR